MNEREKLLVRIEQNQVDRKELGIEADRLKTKLAEIDKPKLRHGDYGIATNDGPIIFINDWADKLMPCGSRSMAQSIEQGRKSYDPQRQMETKLGNIFDDLARNSEDLTEFQVKAKGAGSAFKARSPEYYGDITINAPHSYSYNIDEATEIHQKLGQLIATAKRRNN